MLVDEVYGDYLECYAKLSNDGSTLTILSAGVEYYTQFMAGPFETDIPLAVSENNTKLTSPTDVNYMTEYQWAFCNIICTKK